MNRIVGYQADLLGGPEVPVWSKGKPPRIKETPAESGIRRSAERNEEANPGWHAAVMALVESWVRGRPGLFTIEALRSELASKVKPPTDNRAWGAVTRSAMRRRLIQASGHFAPAVSSNGSPKPLYMSLVGGAS